MKVRLATHDDLPGILEIYNEAVLNTTASYDYDPRTLEHRIAWFEDHEKNNLPVFVAVNEAGRVVGWSALNRYHDRKGYQFTTENSVYIAADLRGRGIGKLLMRPLVDAARQRGVGGRRDRARHACASFTTAKSRAAFLTAPTLDP